MIIIINNCALKYRNFPRIFQGSCQPLDLSPKLPGVFLSYSLMSAHQPLPNFILDFVKTAPSDQKKILLTLLTEDLTHSSTDNVGNGDTPAEKVEEPPKMSVSDFVEHVPDLDIDEELSSGILEELAKLKLRTKGSKGKPAKVKTKWLSPSDEPYNYGAIVNNPKPISDCPYIMQLMNKVNNHPSTSGDMTACLVSCMSSARSNLSYHADDETLMAQDSDICTVSFGPDRSLDFIWQSKNPPGRKGAPPPPDYSVPATNHSLNIMRPGCQQNLMHRVPPGKDGGVRYSLSFRKIVPKEQPETLPELSTPTNLSPAPASTNRKKVTLLAGDSFFERLDEKKLGKGKQEVHKVAKGGRKIDAVERAIESFVTEHPELEIKTLFVCVGTNDIRNCNEGVSHLKTPLSEFMKKIKVLAPSARIFVQSLLPLPSNGNVNVVRNVLSMNNLIFSLCAKYKLFYLDVLPSFLNGYGERNSRLFPAYNLANKFWDIHPNARGMGVLARHYIYLLHSKRFNPLGY